MRRREEKTYWQLAARFLSTDELVSCAAIGDYADGERIIDDLAVLGEKFGVSPEVLHQAIELSRQQGGNYVAE